jgi:hypothetical protein
LLLNAFSDLLDLNVWGPRALLGLFTAREAVNPAQRVADELRRLCKMDDGAETSNVVALR